MRRDFVYLSELISEFLSTSHIEERLSLFNEEEISGWETWLQIELSAFLVNHQSEPEFYREVPLNFDRRSEKEKAFFRPDFLIRKKGWNSNTYAALEIKQHHNPASCIKNMWKDIDKVNKMRSSELNMRTLWALGLFKADSRLDLDELIADTCGEDIPPLHQYDFIGNTGFAYLLF